MLRDLLGQQGFEVGRRHMRTLMKRMEIEAIYRRPNTSKPAPGHRIYPYLLRGVAVTTQSGLGDGHHLHSNGAVIRLSGSGGGLGQPQSFGLAAVDHHGDRVLHGGARRSSFHE